MQWNLIKLRKEHNLSQKDIADALQINLTTYINKELGKSQFKANEMFTLRNLFQKRIEDIFLQTRCSNNAKVRS